MGDEPQPTSYQDPSGAVRLPMAWELFVLGIALVSLLNLFLFALVRNDAVAQVVAVMDIGVTFAFLIDFAARLSVARDRRRYLTRGFGWLDLLSCVPGLRVVKFIRVVAVIRRFRARSHAEEDVDELFHNRARAILLFVLLLTVIVIEFGSMTILAVEEPVEGSNIKTASDALWYLVVTISTIGYGDQYPVIEHGPAGGHDRHHHRSRPLQHPHGLSRSLLLHRRPRRAATRDRAAQGPIEATARHWMRSPSDIRTGSSDLTRQTDDCRRAANGHAIRMMFSGFSRPDTDATKSYVGGITA